MQEQPGFRREKSNLDQVTLLTQSIENAFKAKKYNSVFVYLTGAYGTVWHRDIICKLLRFLLNKHVTRMILELVQNKSFTLTIGDGKPSRLRRLKNGIPQGLIVAPSFSISTHTTCSPSFPRSSPLLTTWRYSTHPES